MPLQNDIATIIIQENSDNAAIFLHHIVNACLKYSQCSSDLKLAGITPAHKKVKYNYRPVKYLSEDEFKKSYEIL